MRAAVVPVVVEPCVRLVVVSLMRGQGGSRGRRRHTGEGHPCSLSGAGPGSETGGRQSWTSVQVDPGPAPGGRPWTGPAVGGYVRGGPARGATRPVREDDAEGRPATDHGGPVAGAVAGG